MDNRNRNIDGIKGLLVILVVVGHVLQGRLDQSIWRYMIYGFHMPFFIAVAGFLFPYERVKTDSISVFLGRYVYRLIVPWAIAMVMYAVYLGAFWGLKSPLWKGWLSHLSVPFYHLWFVPAYLFWSLLLWWMSCRGLSRSKALLLGLLVSLPFFYVKLASMGAMNDVLGANGAGFLIHTLRPHYFLFFVMGMWLREEKLDTRSWVFWVSGAMMFGVYGGIFYFHAGITEGMRDGIWIFANVFLLVAVFRMIRIDALPKSRVMEWMGKESLGIYLWHVLPFLWLKDVIGTRDITQFYGWNLVIEFLFLVVMYGMWRYWKGSRVLFGSR